MQISETHNRDCLEAMREMPDNYAQLAICDPPYGIGQKFQGGKTGKMNFNEIVHKGWDVLPTRDFFTELKRVSINQIIWGGNYFLEHLGSTRCLLLWDKKIAFDFSLAQFEVAWTSFDKLCKKLELKSTENKIHPTQKPVALYKWLLQNYAKQGDRILDTHLGSQSSRIACWDLGFDFVGYELDEDYFREGNERFERHRAQANLFEPIFEVEQPKQESLFI